MDDKGTIMKDAGAMRQHQSMAQKGEPVSGDSFGCKSIASMKGRDMDGPSGKTLDGGARSVGEPIHHSRGKMPAQSQVDHGRHR